MCTGLWVYTHTHMCELMAFCLLPQVSALSSAGGVENLILLEQEKQRPHEVGSVQWAGGTFGPMRKSRLGEHEFEALMRMLDNLVSLLPLSFQTSPLQLSPPEPVSMKHSVDVRTASITIQLLKPLDWQLD